MEIAVNSPITLEIENSRLKSLLNSQTELLQNYKEELQDLRKRVKAQEATLETRDRKIESLNVIIEQQKITISGEVKEVHKKFDVGSYAGLRAQTYKTCLNHMENGKGLLTLEIVDFFRKDYPKVPYNNVQRRIYELGTPQFGNLLFKHADADGKTRWFLNTKVSEANLSHLNDGLK